MSNAREWNSQNRSLMVACGCEHNGNCLGSRAGWWEDTRDNVGLATLTATLARIASWPKGMSAAVARTSCTFCESLWRKGS